METWLSRWGHVLFLQRTWVYISPTEIFKWMIAEDLDTCSLTQEHRFPVSARIILITLITLMYVCVYMRTCNYNLCWGQQTICRAHFFHCTVWVLGIKFRSSAPLPTESSVQSFLTLLTTYWWQPISQVLHKTTLDIFFSKFNFMVYLNFLPSDSR